MQIGKGPQSLVFDAVIFALQILSKCNFESVDLKTYYIHLLKALKKEKLTESTNGVRGRKHMADPVKKTYILGSHMWIFDMKAKSFYCNYIPICSAIFEIIENIST